MMIAVGLMSGTSADGVDVAVCDITGGPDNLKVKLLHGETYAYEAAMRQRILRCCDPSRAASMRSPACILTWRKCLPNARLA